MCWGPLGPSSVPADCLIFLSRATFSDTGTTPGMRVSGAWPQAMRVPPLVTSSYEYSGTTSDVSGLGEAMIRSKENSFQTSISADAICAPPITRLSDQRLPATLGGGVG